MSGKELVDSAKTKALKGERLSRGEIISLLSLAGEYAAYLGSAAREVAAAITNNRYYLWGAIGLDYKPCEMNCDFCSLGKEWGLVKNEYELPEDEVICRVRDYSLDGIRWVVLRTTEFYSIDALCALIGKVKRLVPGAYELGLNIGEIDASAAAKLSSAGCDFIYHSLRLGEGRQTRFEPQIRLNTLHAVRDSAMNLVFLAEPIGTEHTNEEIADIICTVLECKTKVSGAMARIPVTGTPLGDTPQISDDRMAHIIAVTRLACADIVEDICVHPASEKAFAFGANVTVIESGAIPRDGGRWETPWKGFTCKNAKEWFENQNYIQGEV